MITLAMVWTSSSSSVITWIRGIPSEDSLKSCACTMINYVIDRLSIHPSKLLLYILFSLLTRYGHSLGSALSVFLSVYISKTRECGVAGVILQVSISSSCQIELFHVSLSSCVWSSVQREEGSVWNDRYRITGCFLWCRLRISTVQWRSFMEWMMWLFRFLIQNVCFS